MKFPAVGVAGLLTILFLSGLLWAQASDFERPLPIFATPLSPRNANYTIAVDLNTETRTLNGKQIIRWRNTTSKPASELRFHLYLNGFRNNNSTFMLESGGQHRGVPMGEGRWGYIDVNRIQLLSGAGLKDTPPRLDLTTVESDDRLPGLDLTQRMQFVQPDNPEHIHDKSVFRLDLPVSVAPSQSVVLFVDFTATLPNPPFARTGAWKEYFFVGQWFPKIGVLSEQGWNCHQFHSKSEFFSDYGVYDVWMTVPEENIVGATGLQVGEVRKNGDGTATHYYHAEDVHDFAWTTSPEFHVLTGKTQDVNIRLLIQPDHLEQAGRHLEAAKVAIEYFQNWYGDYPFPNLTIVDPRRGAEGSGGMEYPTLITTGTHYGLLETVRTLEQVVIHEFGHNYWYLLVGSNEAEESWLDEGINSYTENLIMHDKYGDGDMLDLFGIKLNGYNMSRAFNIRAGSIDPMLRRSWEFYSPGNSDRSYAVNSYAKPAVVLATVQNYLGKEVMMEVMRTYLSRWRFRHPKSQDFVDVVNEVSGKDMSGFFNQVFTSNALLDYSVDRILSEKAADPRGFDFDVISSDENTVAAENLSTTGDSALAVQSEPQLYRSIVALRRLGGLTFPVEIEVTFSDGTVIEETWDGESPWKTFEYTKTARLVSAQIDPARKITMDINFANNSKTLRPSSTGVAGMSVHWLFWTQFFLDQPTFLNWFRILVPGAF